MRGIRDCRKVCRKSAGAQLTEKEDVEERKRIISFSTDSLYGQRSITTLRGRRNIFNLRVLWVFCPETSKAQRAPERVVYRHSVGEQSMPEADSMTEAENSLPRVPHHLVLVVVIQGARRLSSATSIEALKRGSGRLGLETLCESMSDEDDDAVRCEAMCKCIRVEGCASRAFCSGCSLSKEVAERVARLIGRWNLVAAEKEV
ncbi:hypothetical protein Tco_1570497 [Tanacetum coccineum]